jgi:hypothetical protein
MSRQEWIPREVNRFIVPVVVLLDHDPGSRRHVIFLSPALTASTRPAAPTSGIPSLTPFYSASRASLLARIEVQYAPGIAQARAIVLDHHVDSQRNFRSP